VVTFRTFLGNCRLRTLAILTDDFHSFSQFSQVNFEIVDPLGHDRFLTNHFQFFYSPVVPSALYSKGGHNLARALATEASPSFL
jgi:hypothetical protein